MSYYTSHSLSWNADEPTEEQITAALAPMMEISQEEATSAINGESTKWNDSDDHMTDISKKWPQVLFTMECHGEDGEAYLTFFRNGRSLQKDFEKPAFDEDEFQAKAAPALPGQHLEPRSSSLDDPFLTVSLEFTMQGMLENREPIRAIASEQELRNYKAVCRYLEQLDPAGAERLAEEAAALAENGPAETGNLVDRTFAVIFDHVLSQANAG